MNKRILSLLAVFSLLVTLLSFPVYAQSDPHDEENSATALALARTIPVDDFADPLPRDVEAYLMARMYIQSEENLWALLPPGMVVSEETAPDISDTIASVFAEMYSAVWNSQLSQSDVHVSLLGRSILLDFSIGDMRILYAYYADGGVGKNISATLQGHRYLIRNENNRRIQKNDFDREGDWNSLTSAELSEFQADLRSGLVPYKEWYDIPDVRSYLAEKHGKTYTYELPTHRIDGWAYPLFDPAQGNNLPRSTGPD
ncbi:MAG: hypothetical protein LBT60_01230 [Oscillospiraceae bacterium]|jgi:hypothetical protein|nr:hypothetical protein [Oscillospiraceae bacterium]